MSSIGPTGASAGMALFSLGIFFFALNDALAKWLVTDYSAGQLLLLRTIGAVVVLVPVLRRYPGDIRIKDQHGLHLARILCMAADTYAFYFATKFLPLADVITFYLAAPIMITALSGIFLGEQVGWFRWTAIGVGFVGVVIALKPTGAAFSLPAALALFGSAMFATAVTITRRLRDTHWTVLVTWQFIGGGLIGAAASAFAWTAPSLGDLGLMMLVGAVAIGCFICITKALSLAPASLLAPFHYMSIVWAVILGWAIFGDVPGLNVLLGSLVIVGSGLAVLYRERFAGPAVAAQVEPVP